MARRLPPLSRGTLALLLNAVLGLVALGLAFAPAGEGAPKLRLASASGALSLSNSKEGAAIFHAEAMRPGEEASGSVTITNTGTVDAALTLTPEATGDTPGNGGGKLSNKLELLVLDVTTVSLPVTVYAGTLKQMDPTNVGSLAPGAHRTYLFVASLRPNGSSDNAFQGAALTTGFRWDATGDRLADPDPTPIPTPDPDRHARAAASATPEPPPRPRPAPARRPRPRRCRPPTPAPTRPASCSAPSCSRCPPRRGSA